MNGFWGPFGSVTPLHAPMGPEVGGAEKLRTGNQIYFSFIWAPSGVLMEPFFRQFSYKSRLQDEFGIEEFVKNEGFGECLGVVKT